MTSVPDESVHLVCTSPPYAFLKEYTPGTEGQLGDLLDYDEFLDELDKVWREAQRVLVPGGRVACVVGDVCISRKRGGRHFVLPLSADIQARVRRLGLDNLTPIRWYKVANIALEASRSSVFLGKPNQPGGVIKNDVEHILLMRKPGAYRKPTQDMIDRSRIDTEQYTKWFTSIWQGVTGQLRTSHPAPYPLEVPRRLIQMFSFAGDTVLDPFGGTGTTTLAAIETGRSSVMYEIDPDYVELVRERLAKEKVTAAISFEESRPRGASPEGALSELRERLVAAITGTESLDEIEKILAEARASLEQRRSGKRITAG